MPCTHKINLFQLAVPDNNYATLQPTKIYIKKIIFFSFSLSNSLSHNKQTLSLFLSLQLHFAFLFQSSASIPIPTCFNSDGVEPSIKRINKKKRVPLFLGFSSLHYMYIQHSCYILRWWCFYIQVFGRGGGRGGGSGSNKPDCVLCLSAQGHFLSALSVSTIQRWWYTIALCVLCDVREKRKCCFK